MTELTRRFGHAQDALDEAQGAVEHLMERLRAAVREHAAIAARGEERVEQVRDEARKSRAALATVALRALKSLSTHLTHTLIGLRGGAHAIEGLRGAQLRKLETAYPRLAMHVGPDAPPLARMPVQPVTPSRYGLPLPSVTVCSPPSTPRRPATSPRSARAIEPAGGLPLPLNGHAGPGAVTAAPPLPPEPLAPACGSPNEILAERWATLGLDPVVSSSKCHSAPLVRRGGATASLGGVRTLRSAAGVRVLESR